MPDPEDQGPTPYATPAEGGADPEGERVECDEADAGRVDTTELDRAEEDNII
jgi:hypothetical protein